MIPPGSFFMYRKVEYCVSSADIKENIPADLEISSSAGISTFI